MLELAVCKRDAYRQFSPPASAHQRGGWRVGASFRAQQPTVEQRAKMIKARNNSIYNRFDVLEDAAMCTNGTRVIGLIEQPNSLPFVHE
jgi:hypothetical protein